LQLLGHVETGFVERQLLDEWEYAGRRFRELVG
jgi:hypothetical protein